MAFVPSLPRALFVPNEDFDEEYTDSKEGANQLVDAGEAVMSIAQATAPVLTGAYRDGFEVRIVEGEILLVNTDFKANWIEFGTATHPAQATMRRAVQAAGYKLVETPKT